MNRTVRGRQRLSESARQAGTWNGRSAKHIFDGKRPARQSRFGVGNFAAAEDGGVLRSAGAIHSDQFILQHIDVPNHHRAGGKIIAALGGQFAFASRTVVLFASHFHGKEHPPETCRRVRGPM